MATCSSHWDFEFEAQPSELHGRHILDDVPELITLQHPESDQEATEGTESTNQLMNGLLDLSPEPDRISNQETKEHDHDDQLLNTSNTTRTSDSSHQSFRSTISKRSNQSDALHAFLFPIPNKDTPTRSPIRSLTQPVHRKRKRILRDDQISLSISSSTGSARSSGSFQAVSTSYSALKKKRKSFQSLPTRTGPGSISKSNSNRNQRNNASPNATISNRNHRNRINQPLSNHSNHCDPDVLTFNSDLLSTNYSEDSSRFHSLRWPSHIFRGNRSVCIRLKGVYHPASIEAVSNDFFVLKMTTPRTGTIKCVRFSYAVFMKDTDRVISMMDASQLTQTQSQSQNISQKMPWTQSQNRSTYVPMQRVSEEENENELSSLNVSDDSNPMNLSMESGNGTNIVHSVNDDTFCLEETRLLQLRSINDSQESKENGVVDVLDNSNAVNGNEGNQSVSEQQIESKQTRNSDSNSSSNSKPSDNDDDDDEDEDCDESRRRSLRLQNKRRRLRVQTEIDISDSLSNSNSNSDSGSVEDDAEFREMGIRKHTKVTRLRQRSSVSYNYSTKRKKYRMWSKEEEEALIGAFKKHRYDYDAVNGKKGTFKDILNDEEFGDIFKRNGRDTKKLRYKWKTLNKKLKLIEKWDNEKREVRERGVVQVQQQCDGNDYGNSSRGKSEEDASD